MRQNLAKYVSEMHGVFKVYSRIEFTAPERINIDQCIKKNVICYCVELDALATIRSLLGGT